MDDGIAADLREVSHGFRRGVGGWAVVWAACEQIERARQHVETQQAIRQLPALDFEAVDARELPPGAKRTWLLDCTHRIDPGEDGPVFYVRTGRESLCPGCAEEAIKADKYRLADVEAFARFASLQLDAARERMEGVADRLPRIPVAPGASGRPRAAVAE
jgi:hypothetical protein